MVGFVSPPQGKIDNTKDCLKLAVKEAFLYMCSFRYILNGGQL